MINLLINILALAFVLGVIIVIHEAGHLLLAKTFGVRVLTFSVGFGKRIFGFRRGDTDYRLSLVPLGGYVRMDGENPEEASGDSRQFLSKPRWQRVLVFLAGPAMNVVLSVALFAVLFMIGIQAPNLPGIAPVIGGVEDGSSAARAGLQRGDVILKINGETAKSWQDVSMALLTAPEKPVALELKRADHVFAASVTPKRVPRWDVGDFAGLFPQLQTAIREVLPGKPAAAAGLRPGDKIRAVDGRLVTGSQDFVHAIEQRPGRPVVLQVIRDGRTLAVAVVPALEGKLGKIGVSVESVGLYQHYPPLAALRASIDLNIEIVTETFQVLGKIFRREMSARSALSGPIEIASESGDAARRSTKELFYMMGAISLSIAILNLMPIPILDGGQILILLVEEVIRRDLPLRVKEIISQVGLVLILMLMVVVCWFDLSKHLPAGLLPGS
jgi:regulator of sigma E protease